jgi:LacI family transcriptional regulator
MTMATIRDVAKKANVSVATVSRVLNNKGYVSEEAQKAVMAAIAALDYTPNSVARTLYNKSSGMIGLVLPDITNPFFPELARAVEDVALTYGYTVVLCNSDEEVAKEKKYFEALKQKYIDGIILTTSSLTPKDYDRLDLPMVALDRRIGDHIPTVVSENKQGACEATEHLLAKGCRYLAHLRGPKGVKTADERYKGFMEVVKRHRVEHVVLEAEFHIDKAEATARELFTTYPQVDGVFAGSDVTAAGVMKAAHTLNKKIPTDIRLIGFDGIPLGKMLVPALSTVEQSIYKMGALSARLLIKQIEKQPMPSMYYELPVTLIARETT